MPKRSSTKQRITSVRQAELASDTCEFAQLSIRAACAERTHTLRRFENSRNVEMKKTVSNEGNSGSNERRGGAMHRHGGLKVSVVYRVPDGLNRLNEQRLIAEQGGLDQGLLSRDRRAIREKSRLDRRSESGFRISPAACILQSRLREDGRTNQRVCAGAGVVRIDRER